MGCDRLKGKVAIVVGVNADGGTGRAAALAFAREGAAVTVASRTRSKVDKVAADIKSIGGRSLGIATDATIKEQVDAMVDATVKQFGTVDILFYNAGGGGPARGPVGDISTEDWRATLDKNVTGAFLCSGAVVKRMIAQNRGRIIITASGTGVRPVSGDMPAYSVSNAAEIALARSLAAQTAPYNVTANVICPGGINSAEWIEVASRRLPSSHKGPVNPQRFNQPEEIADVVLFLASYESRAITGAVINLYFRSDLRAHTVWRQNEPQYIERPEQYSW